MTQKLVFPLDAVPSDQAIGAKAEQLRWLVDNGYRVPTTFILPFSAEAAYHRRPDAFERQLEGELADLLDPDTHFAVRSSVNVEDREEHSFAGQFTTKLDIRGPKAVGEAVIMLYDQLTAAPPEAYLERIGAAGTSLTMALIIQQMVNPVFSGVAFSKNPVTGLDEVIVEAVEGSGAAMLQGGKNPDRWVAKWGGWTEQPEISSIDQALIETVVEQTKTAAAVYGAPVDLEWVYGDEALYWVQIRRITTTGQINIYSNRIAREVIPGLIKPLVWSINTPLVNRAWVDLFTELIGPNDIQPEDLARPFYYRAYFNMGVIGRIFEILGFPPETLELLLGLEGGKDRPTFRPTRKTLRHFPRMIKFLADKLRFQRVADQKLPELQEEFRRFAGSDLDPEQPERLLADIEALWAVTQEAAYLNIVIPLLMSVYSALLKRLLTALDVDYAQFDLTAGHEGLGNYDPGVHLAALNKEFTSLADPARDLVLNTDPDTWLANPELAGFHQSFLEFLERFGHLSDSGNDFSSRPWREDHALVLEMVANHAPIDRERERITFEDLRPAPHQNLPIKMVYRRARQFRYYREAVSSLYTSGYGLFRQHFLTLGCYLENQGWITEEEDIFYLTYDEVKALVDQGPAGEPPKEVISKRKAELESAGEIILPELIYGDEPPPPKFSQDPKPNLTGIPSSRGYYQGPVTVIKQIQDFGRLNRGDVLVIPFSDVSWTPLFGIAGAVIAESGGLLSHSAIVAREFNIPCVVSVNGACQLPDKVLVGVDGYSGEITIIDPPG